MLMAMLSVLPSVAGSSLLIHLKDGTDVICSLSKEPQMEFGEKTITLTSLKGTVEQWNFSDVESWEYADMLDDDEIDAVKDVRINIHDSEFVIHNSQVAVYDLSGRRVNPKLQKTGNITRASLRGLPKGTYLLKVGDNCVKFSIGR